MDNDKQDKVGKLDAFVRSKKLLRSPIEEIAEARKRLEVAWVDLSGETEFSSA